MIHLAEICVFLTRNTCCLCGKEKCTLPVPRIQYLLRSHSIVCVRIHSVCCWHSAMLPKDISFPWLLSFSLSRFPLPRPICLNVLCCMFQSLDAVVRFLTFFLFAMPYFRFFHRHTFHTYAQTCRIN